MSDIHYREMNAGEEAEVSAHVLSVFEESIAPEYSEDGVREFRRYVAPEAFRERVQRDYIVWVATVSDQVTGMIELREQNHVSLLFVGKAFRRKGVARGLLDHGLTAAHTEATALERVTVNSSAHGVPAFERLGFRQTGPERTVNGIAFVPMAMKLDTADGV